MDRARLVLRPQSRVARMIRALLDRREEIERADKFGLTFDCAGPKVSIETRRRDEAPPSG